MSPFRSLASRPLDFGLLTVGGGVVHVPVLPGPDDIGGVLAGPPSEYQRIEERVRAQPVAAMYAHAGDLARGVQARDHSLAVHIGLDSTHLVVHSRADGHRLLEQVDVREVAGYVQNLGQTLADYALAEVSHVEEHASIEAPALVDLGLLGAGDHVA